MSPRRATRSATGWPAPKRSALDRSEVTTCSRRLRSHRPRSGPGDDTRDLRPHARCRDAVAGHHGADDGAEIHLGQVELDPRAGEGDGVEDLARQGGEAAHLPPDRQQRPLQRAVLQRHRPVSPHEQHVGGRLQGRDRGAELVRRHREELVAGAERRLGPVVEARDLDRQRGAPRQVLGHGEVLGSEVPGARPREAHGPQQPPGDGEGHAQEGLVPLVGDPERALRWVARHRARVRAVRGEGDASRRAVRLQHVHRAAVGERPGHQLSQALQRRLVVERGEQAARLRQEPGAPLRRLRGLARGPLPSRRRSRSASAQRRPVTSRNDQTRPIGRPSRRCACE